ncbi:TIGR03668 family PPOX class F420-dependent oxidoreductase [Luteipulveratus mongoliensis]|uniref:F420-dependent protein n=1 Tax=Luteipulveratus mongoliensis TaxID=571913 RepID=A0A0K1JQ79_9MICO|nr:TIGR03668 family PPOX class F420-dependent oxidoreductase [Luteipulveratus mongoliensis]AKU18882.1 F420-dependent protein [Luteipulveratus mongoliensis]
MRLDEDGVRRRLTPARVARLATVGSSGAPHLVPITFVVDGDALLFAVDHKPKTTTALQRLRNIERNPAVCVLADEYDEDWSQLWWARVDGQAAVLDDPADIAAAMRALQGKYEQYRERPPHDLVVRIDITAWTGWAASSS